MSTTQNPELLYGSASSFGTLGITTLLKIELREAKTYVELRYWPTANMTEALEKIEEKIQDPETDSVDEILFAANKGVIRTGRLRDEPRSRVQRFSRKCNFGAISFHYCLFTAPKMYLLACVLLPDSFLSPDICSCPLPFGIISTPVQPFVLNILLPRIIFWQIVCSEITFCDLLFAPEFCVLARKKCC